MTMRVLKCIYKNTGAKGNQNMRQYKKALTSVNKSLRRSLSLRTLVMTLAVLVVFVTTYLLVMPAFTLGREEALSQGGIDVPAVAEETEAESDADKDGFAASTGSETGSVGESDGKESSTSSQVELKYEADDYTVRVSGSNAGLAEDMTVKVDEIEESDKDKQQEYKQLYEDTLKAIQETQDGESVSGLSFARFYDISIMDGGKAVDPDSEVGVTITFEKALQKALSKEAGAIDPASVRIVHFAENEKTGEITPEVLDVRDVDITVKNDRMTEAAFTADSFSVYGVIYTELSDTVITASGETYTVTAAYSDEAEIPDGAELEVNELLPDGNDNYEDYVAYTENALGIKEGSAEYIRLFDISIVDRDDPEIKYQPKEGTTVDVRIELTDAEDWKDLSVVHFADENDKGSKVSAGTDGQTVVFEADGFSVYAIVDGPSGAEAGWSKLTSLGNLTSKGYYIGHTSGYFLMGTETSKASGDDTIIGINRNGKKSVPDISKAVPYYFENASDGKYYIYCMDGDNRRYVVNNEDASLSLGTDENDKTLFTVEANDSGVFKIHNGDWYWNMQTGTGEGFYSKNNANDGNNNLYLWEPTDPDTDTYGLNGESYGLMTWTGGKTAKALMAVENNGKDENDQPYSGCLEAKFLTVMTHESDAGNKLYVPDNTSDTVTKWTFEWVRNDSNNRLNSYYYLKADNGKYLKITSGGLTLVDEDERDESCLIQAKPGTGKNEGQICLKSVGSGSKTLTYSGEYAKGYNIGGTAGSEWLYLVGDQPEEVLADYEKVYTASKVSVSDT